MSRQEKNDSEEVQPPLSREQFAWSSIGLVVALFLFLGSGNLTGVQFASLALAGTKALSWYYYDKKLDLFFAVGYLLTVFWWQALLASGGG